MPVKTIKDVISKLKKLKMEIPEYLFEYPKNTQLSKIKKNTPLLKSVWMWDIDGIGPSRALAYHKKGVTKRNLRKQTDLPILTKLSLKHKPLKKIHRTMVLKAYNSLFSEPKLNKKSMLVGSYRRQCTYSGDVDVLYWGNFEKFKNILEENHGKNWIPYAEGKTKISGMYKFGSKVVKVDIWKTTPKNKHAMLFYSTGSRIHNIVTRHKAKKLNMILNQYGLHKADGTHIPTTTERSIYKKLNMKYIKPENR